MTAFAKLNRKLFIETLMLLMTASQLFGQVKSDSILVSRIDLIKQIELNDRNKAELNHSNKVISVGDSVVLASRKYIASLDTVIALKDETISLLTLAKDVAIDNRNELREQLKLQKRKTLIKSVGWGVGGVGLGVILGVTAVILAK
jgi:hypothetical protein